MTRVQWDNTGQRIFEVGTDRGMLYPATSRGVVWNGLVSVNEQTEGGEINPFYLDGIRYANVAALSEYKATLEAFTYPDKFSEINGLQGAGNGLYFDNQQKADFGLSYRTLVGNEVNGHELGYKIHLVYNAIASPTQGQYKTRSNPDDLIPFSWTIMTRHVRNYDPRDPTAHLVIDSTMTHSSVLKAIEAILYGTKTKDPRLPSFAEIDKIFTRSQSLRIHHNGSNGLSELSIEQYSGDLLSYDKFNTGLYERPRSSRLAVYKSDGLYRLD